jgi:hypothetical protein
MNAPQSFQLHYEPMLSSVKPQDDIWYPKSRRNLMKPMVRVAVVLCLASAPGIAESWRGALVDSKCFDSEQRNINPFEPYHDDELDVRLCRPNAHTKLFAIVQHDWVDLKLDSEGNAKAAEIVRSADKKKIYWGVVVTGEKTKNTLKVESISAIP